MIVRAYVIERMEEEEGGREREICKQAQYRT
jgi:hypothetical protein